jgi:hypothetical protein
MDPVTMAALSGIGGAGISALGKAFSGGDRREAEEQMRKALAEYGFGPSQIEEVIAQQLGPSAQEGVTTDPQYKEAQQRALNSFLEMEQSGGLTLADQAAQNKVMNKVARQESAGRSAITNDMAARGTLGGGAELAMKLKNQQDGAARANEVGMDTAANAQRRYFDSILARGNTAGNMRDQEFGEKSRAAEAADRIAQYNADMRYRANVQRNNDRARRFDQKMGLADARAGVRTGMAGQKRQDAKSTQEMWGGIGSGVNQAGNTYANYKQGQQGLKDEDDFYGR